MSYAKHTRSSTSKPLLEPLIFVNFLEVILILGSGGSTVASLFYTTPSPGICILQTVYLFIYLFICEPTYCNLYILRRQRLMAGAGRARLPIECSNDMLYKDKYK